MIFLTLLSVPPHLRGWVIEWVSEWSNLEGWVGLWLFGKATPPNNALFKLAIQTSLGTWNWGNPQLWGCWVLGCFSFFDWIVCFCLIFDYFRWLSEKDPKNSGRQSWLTTFSQPRPMISERQMLVIACECRICSSRFTMSLAMLTYLWQSLIFKYYIFNWITLMDESVLWSIQEGFDPFSINMQIFRLSHSNDNGKVQGL